MEVATHLVLLELLDISGHLLLCLGLGPLLILSCKKNQSSEQWSQREVSSAPTNSYLVGSQFPLPFNLWKEG